MIDHIINISIHISIHVFSDKIICLAVNSRFNSFNSSSRFLAMQASIYFTIFPSTQRKQETTNIWLEALNTSRLFHILTKNQACLFSGDLSILQKVLPWFWSASKMLVFGLLGNFFWGVFGPRYLSTYLKFTENMAILKLSLQFQKTRQSFTPTTIHTSKQLESQLAKWRKIYIRTKIFIFRSSRMFSYFFVLKCIKNELFSRLTNKLTRFTQIQI